MTDLTLLVKLFLLKRKRGRERAVGARARLRILGEREKILLQLGFSFMLRTDYEAMAINLNNCII